MTNKKVRMVDPPDGWMYGFPKPYTPYEDQDFANWLMAEDYPFEKLDLALKYSRWWEEEEEE